MNAFRRLLAVALLLVIVAAAAGAVYERYQRGIVEREYPPAGKLVPVGDHRLHAVVRGDSGPSVVFESGSDVGGHLPWRYVQQQVAGFARTLSYDRSGILWSEYAGTPRTCDTMANELRALLRATGLDSPFVLVGHSMGGLILRCFVANYPGEVAGVVLVDASHPALLERAPPRANALELPFPRWQMVLARELGIARLFLASSYPRIPADEPVSREAHVLGLRSAPALYDEFADIETLVARAAEIDSFGSIPLVVITGDAPDRFEGTWEDEQLRREMQALWTELQADLLHLSTDSRQLPARESGHYIQLEQPELVAAAIRDLLRRDSPEDAGRHAPQHPATGSPAPGVGTGGNG